MMEKKKRIEYLEKLQKKKSHTTSELYYKNETKIMEVYQIDMSFLIYNPYNGRIASLVKTYEKEHGALDSTIKKDSQKIENFLWESKPGRNEKTKQSLAEQGQLKHGIVSKDGVIIDGNRRAMLLKKVFTEKQESPQYFKAIILPDALDEDPKEIMRLETEYQMGEDAKVDYNSIEKYLKCKELEGQEFSNDQIGKMMSETKDKIKENLEIMELMDEYLEKINAQGIYTRLDDTEGLFVNLNSYLNKYKGGKSKLVQWNYGDTDINDLKLVYFDIIRHTYNTPKGEGVEAKEARIVGQTSKKESFFSDEKIWTTFRDEHFKVADAVRKKLPSIEELRKENPGKDFNTLFKHIDETFAKKVDPGFKKNMGLTAEALDNRNKENRWSC